MAIPQHLTKIVATIGPASRSPNVFRRMVEAGVTVARLNFSHGSYADHAKTITMIREVSEEMDVPITILQDLQGPKIRVGELPPTGIKLIEGNSITLIPIDPNQTSDRHYADAITIDYPYVAEEATIGTQILLADGIFELKVTGLEGNAVYCEVIKGGILTSHKGVNFPSLNLRLPSMTEKDQQDLAFGLAQGVDWISLSFVRQAADVKRLKSLIAEHGKTDISIIAKIEKPQAIANLEEIIAVVDGIMVARGDLGVEMPPERVPMIQKHIIRRCNEVGIPVITATQMLESMIQNPRPTRAEASDVANAIMDGTDAVMLSGESAVGDYPVQAVEMMTRIASEVEKDASFINYPASRTDEVHAISEALHAISDVIDFRCIVAFTATGYTAILASKERLKLPIIALTPSINVYHRLNLVWGVKPLLLEQEVNSFEMVIQQVESYLIGRNLASQGDRVLIVGGIPMGVQGGTNFLKIHILS
ncbi:pyruvate kinase [Pseudanabaena yagii]|uniref:Pyruvate kinase n=1 Tax=Pseudanabaena yagii GIHE-NHR1 TaxID=2722753 RepID=A0ABX1LP93_9CYAN|nr:pyruvate kinase [Pseudanabaena yagii]NMF57136.1 pyruvate kinase [Pseudanabaena yagii GIHE-NHR1]